MKRLPALTLLLCLIQHSPAQVTFCPLAAEWHYKFSEFFGGIYNEQIKYVRDSVLGAETVRVLEHSRYWKNQNVEHWPKLSLIKQNGDTVFFRSQITQHNWQILYNYGALPGQNWVNNISVFSTSPTTLAVSYTITVDSVKNVNINSFNLRELYVKYWSKYNAPQAGGYEKATITERFGCNRFLFNFFNDNWVTDNEMVSGFLCYEDYQFGLKQFTSKPCDYVDYVGVPEKYQNANIKIYPNPASDFFTVDSRDELLSGNSLLSIKDLSGREVKRLAIDLGIEGSSYIDISGLANGIYLLNISNDSRPVYSGKLLVN